jgi:hypothetical protein
LNGDSCLNCGLLFSAVPHLPVIQRYGVGYCSESCLDKDTLHEVEMEIYDYQLADPSSARLSILRAEALNLKKKLGLPLIILDSPFEK